MYFNEVSSTIKVSNYEGRSSKNRVRKTKKFKKNPKICMRHDFLAFINSMRKRRMENGEMVERS